jgi:ParB-like nuclease family protein
MTTPPTTNTANTASNPDEAIQKTLTEDAKRRDEQRKAEAAKYEFKFHPDCLAMGEPMSDQDLDVLAKDIQANGLLEPITISAGMILDGRNRYLACKKAGRKFDDKDFVELPTRLDPLTFVISKNINRRHWTAEQKREAIKKLVAQNPNMSSRAIAAVGHVSHNTVEKIRQEIAEEQKATGQSDQLTEKRVGKDGKARKAPKKKTESAKDLKEQLDDFKETWDGFNTSQKNSFVKAYKDEIAEILQAVEMELEFEQQEEEGIAQH